MTSPAQRNITLLFEARRRLRETEEVAKATEEELKIQGEKMTKNLQQEKDINQKLNKSNKLLSKIARWFK